MKKDDVMKAFEMRLNGNTLEEIGQHFGVSREYIRQVLSDRTKKRSSKKVKEIIYPGLRDWFRINNTTPCKLNNEIKIVNSMKLLHMSLRGERDFRISEIETILGYTGMTFEEAFGDGGL